MQEYYSHRSCHNCIGLRNQLIMVYDYNPRQTYSTGQLGKLISLVFRKKGYQEAFPFPSGTGSGSFRNIKITETSKSIAWKQVVCFTCTPFQVNWITCLCRRTYLQKWYKVINFNHMSGTVLQCIYYKVGEREIVWISLPLKREGKFVLPCIIPLGRYSLRTPDKHLV